MKITNFFKSFLVLSISLIFSESHQAQTIQTYNGIFENGKAIYQYYENEQSDRIYQGSFKYTGAVYSYLGAFWDNKRKGKWKITAVNKSYSNGKNKILINATVLPNYKNGMMDSIWSYSTAVKIYNPKTKKPGTKIDKTTARASFKDNHFAGKFSYEKSYIAKTTINGQFSDLGFAEGVWTVKTQKQTEEIKFNKGMVYARVVKDITTGEKLVSYDSSAFISNFWELYNKNTKTAEIKGKIYFLDTVQVNNEALYPWKSDLCNVETFGNMINPIYAYKKAQAIPDGFEVKIIACENNTDCFEAYLKRKNDEAERQNKLKNEEDERIRLENIAKEEQIKLEEQRQMERLKQEQLAEVVKSGDAMSEQKKYKEALSFYNEALKIQPDKLITEKITACHTQLVRIDSLHNQQKTIYVKLVSECTPVFDNINATETALKAKKKAYAKNYVLCMYDMKGAFSPKLTGLDFISTIDQNPEALSVWTDDDQQSLDLLHTLEKQASEISAFQKGVTDAIASNNKNKLRILNSSINPKVIIHDLINFK